MTLLALLAITTALVVPTFTRWLFDRQGNWSSHVMAFETVLTISALVLGAGWFLVERPDAARLEVQMTGTSYKFDDARALVVIELGLKNIGVTAMNLRGRPYRLSIQQVSPVDSRIIADLNPLPGATVGSVRPGDQWVTLAVLDDRAIADRKNPIQATSMSTMDSFLEAGETENLYYRALVPCSQGLQIAVTLHMPKPSTWFDGAQDGDLWWVKQTILDLTEQCKSSKD